MLKPIEKKYNHNYSNYFFIIFLFLNIVCVRAKNTQNFMFARLDHPGRFGNCLEDYAVGQYLAQKYKKIYVSGPFEYSDRLVLHNFGKKDMNFNSYKQILLEYEKDIPKILRKNRDSNIMFLCNHTIRLSLSKDFFPDYHNDERKIAKISRNPGVLNILKSHLRPNFALPKIPHRGLPSVAMHIRTGGEFAIDKEYVKEVLEGISAGTPFRDFFILKYVQVIGYDFYFQALKEIQRDLGKVPLYVRIFTDSSNPEEVVKIFKKKFAQESFYFDYQKSKSGHDVNVVEDFFMMLKFDYFIRSFSTYSSIAQMLGNYKEVIYPAFGVVENGRFCLKKIDIVYPQKNWEVKQIDFSQLGVG